jgi:Flp pilus assembly protein TadB
MPAFAFGGALVLSGLLLSHGIAAEQGGRWLTRLGGSPSDRGRAVAGNVTSRLRENRHRVIFYGAILGGAVVGNHLLGPVGLVACAFAGPLITRAREARRSAARRDLLDRQLGEAVGAIAAALRAGLSVRRAVAEAARGAEQPLRGELESVVARVETGEPLDSALARLDRRLGLSDAGLVVTALGVHRRTGGDLPRLLDEIEKVIRARREERGAVHALTAQARSSGVVLAVLPIAFVALLSGTGGDGLGAFYRTPSGAALLIVALCCQALGFAWMRRIVQRVDLP